MLSYVIGFFDYLYFPMRWFMGKNRPKFFRNGWGDNKKLEEAHGRFKDLCFYPKEERLAIDWTTEKKKSVGSGKFVYVASGRFTSPLALQLPPEARVCHVERVSCTPVDAEQNQSTGTSGIERVAFFFPATGEQGRGGRVNLATDLAKNDGITSYIITAPFYQKRRPDGQKMHYVDNVADYILQSYAIVIEGVVLAKHVAKLHSENAPKTPLHLFFTGYSWGGAMSSLSGSASAFSLREDRNCSVAVIPYCGSATPAPVTDGILAGDIDWAALKEGNEVYEETRQRLLKYFAAVNLKSLAGDGVTAHLDAVVMGSAQHDIFVIPSYSDQLREQLSDFMVDKDAIVHQWLVGGHVWAFLRRKSAQLPLVRQAVVMLAKRK